MKKVTPRLEKLREVVPALLHGSWGQSEQTKAEDGIKSWSNARGLGHQAQVHATVMPESK